MQRTSSSIELFEPSKRRKLVKAKPVQVMAVEQPARRKRSRSNASLATEKKFLDNSLVNQALVAGTGWAAAELDPATTLCLTAPAQGDTASSRDGKQIIGKYLVIKGQIYSSTSEAVADPPQPTQVYLAVVLDKQTNNAQLNSEDVMINVAADNGLNPYPLRNLNFGKRFKILKEECWVMDNTTFTTAAANSFSKSGRAVNFNWYIPLKDLRINFNSTTTGVIGNVLDNSVHLVGIANSTIEAPTISYQARFRFIG